MVMFDFFTSTTEQVDYISYKYLFTKEYTKNWLVDIKKPPFLKQKYNHTEKSKAKLRGTKLEVFTTYDNTIMSVAITE